MTRIKSLLAGVVASAIVAVVPATAQTVHVAGAGSSAQFLSAAIGADTLALSLPNVGVPTYSSNSSNCNTNGDTLASYHYSAKNQAYIVDVRSSNINPEEGNLWVVWTADCSDPTGATGVQDIWLDVSVDSTVGVRALHAQETSGAGAQVGIVAPPVGPANLIGANAIWPDNSGDIALPANVYNVIGTGITNTTAGSDVHVNVGLTDIRPEDALVATTRTLCNGNASLSCLGYRLIQGNANYGVSILSGQTGSTAKATPENFSLGGGDDPITGKAVPATTTIPIGAAPIVFGLNNNGAASYPTNLISGVRGNGSSGGPYLLANLFDGTTICDTTNPAFGFSGTPTFSINPILREPLSGTMNTTEFSLFRTTGNTSDSQEMGISGAGARSEAPTNPVNSTTGVCSAGGGYRSRAIGTGEVTAGIDSIAGGLGYFFWSFSNGGKFKGGANYNYLTIDGVDPLGGIGGAGQTFPYCPTGTATNCPASLWPNNISYPTLRNGTYGAWSIYRWVVYTSNTDPVGPAALAAAAQNAIDTTVADYVPFYTATGGIGGVSDGLSVYHSHFKDTVPLGSCSPVATCKSVTGVNGAATSANATNGGNTLGGGDEAGGDVGGVIEGPFGIAEAFSGTVTTSATHTNNKGYKVTWTAGQKFLANAAWEGQSITIDSVVYTIANVLPTTTTLYVTTSPGTATGQSYSATLPTALAKTPGTLNKKR